MISKKVLNDRLTKTENKPRLAYDNKWYQDDAFCRGFLGRCEHRVLTKGPDALSLAHRAVEFARLNGDQHLVNLSRGLLVHAFIAESLFFWANATLESYRDSALSCCRRCRGDFHLRSGDLLGEQRQPRESIAALDRCLREWGDDIAPDMRGRVFYLRGVAHHLAGDRTQALNDMGSALMLMALDSPRGFFLDAIAFLCVFLGGDDPRDDELALAHVTRFRERIKGEGSEWSDARARLFWVEGQIAARLGDFRRARRAFDQAIAKVVPDGLPREAVAVVLDGAQLRCRREEPRVEDIRVAKRLLKSCRERRDDLDPAHVKALKKLEEALDAKPENAFHITGAVRKTVFSPVPNRLDLLRQSPRTSG